MVHAARRRRRTHLVVDACSAPSVIERLNADPRRAEAIATAARAVHDSLLCADCLARYFASVVDHFRRHFALGPVLDHDRLSIADCSHLDLLEVRGAGGLHLQRVGGDHGAVGVGDQGLGGAQGDTGGENLRRHSGVRS